MTRTFGAETASSRASSAACGMTCSQLSITTSRRLSRSAETKLSVSRASGATVRSTSQANGMKSAGSSSIARSKNHVPSGKKPASRRAISIAMRVLPTPPAPVMRDDRRRSTALLSRVTSSW